MLNCLQILQTVYRRIGLTTAPTAAVGSTDPAVLQMVSLMEDEGQDQATRYAWQTLQKEATFTTVATETQTTVAAITTGFDFIVNNTIWNRSLRRPVYGPNSQQDWQQKKAMQINGPWNSFRIKGDSILFNPIPAAGQLCYFEYQSLNWVTLNAGGTASTFANDLDVPLLNDQLIVLGTMWRWKQQKGLDFKTDFDKYEKRLLDAMGRDAGKQRLAMDGAQYDINPVVMVPAGSWGV